MPGERQSNLRRLVCTLIAAHLLLGIAMFATAAWAKPQTTTDSLLSVAQLLEKAKSLLLSAALPMRRSRTWRCPEANEPQSTCKQVASSWIAVRRALQVRSSRSSILSRLPIFVESPNSFRLEFTFLGVQPLKRFHFSPGFVWLI